MVDAEIAIVLALDKIIHTYIYKYIYINIYI